jgi:UPF0042 nucleotide-binding protein
MERLVIITGLSGSGKTLAADCFEDLGYFCVDNLPVGLIPPFCELIQRGGEQIRKAALVIDAREGAFLKGFPEIFHSVRSRRILVELLFLDCSDDVLKRRFSESRRPHPLTAPQGRLEQAIESERAALGPLREIADRVIDTSSFTPHELRNFLVNAYGGSDRADAPNVNVVSFGYKYGVPAEADLMFDVRFLPNPHFDDRLRGLDGRDQPVQEFLDKSELAVEFQERLNGFVDYLIPLYGHEGKSYLTVAIGCTGGKHRSVALAERLGRFLVSRDVPASVHHRDLGRE